MFAASAGSELKSFSPDMADKGNTRSRATEAIPGKDNALNLQHVSYAC